MSNISRIYQNLPALIVDWVFGNEFTTPIRPAKHGDSSGVRGAAWLGNQLFLDCSAKKAKPTTS
ncbi:MAG: hypothetical protein CM1200mP30_31120 [Pseudomonadota bacterium]|nr:MAG: hypothetical protein CM1200mP30_31120 [Pseudomonadota bacterium]